MASPSLALAAWMTVSGNGSRPSGQTDDPANFLVRHVQDATQNQDALVLSRQAGERLGYQLIANAQIISVGAEYKAVAGVVVYGAGLVPFTRSQSVKGNFVFPAVGQLTQIVDGLMFQHQLAEAVKLTLFAAFAGDFHFLTPFRRGMILVFPFPLTKRTGQCVLPGIGLLF